MKTFLTCMMFAISFSVNAQNCAGFTDVPASDPFCSSITWMKNSGVTLGCSATEFCPTGNVTRAQMAAFMSRFNNYQAPRVEIQKFAGSIPKVNHPQLGSVWLCRPVEEALVTDQVPYETVINWRAAWSMRNPLLNSGSWSMAVKVQPHIPPHPLLWGGIDMTVSQDNADTYTGIQNEGFIRIPANVSFKVILKLEHIASVGWPTLSSNVHSNCSLIIQQRPATALDSHLPLMPLPTV